MSGRWLELAVMLALATGEAWAQAPAAPPSPAPSPSPAAEEAAPAAAEEAEPVKAPETRPAQCTPEAPCLRADFQEGLEKGHFRARGFVDFQSGDTRVQADLCDIFETQDPDGVARRRLEASGNVVFLRGDERLSGDSLKLDMTTGQGTFEHAFGYVSPGVFIEASQIARLSADSYRIEHGRFSSCAQPSPRWSFSASTARLKVDHRITGWNVIFRVKQVPAFYLPYFTYPINRDERATGFLLPVAGYSKLRGFHIGEGFFWAMGRSADQTFFADHYTTFGNGVGHELRYVLDSPTHGHFRSYIFRPSPVASPAVTDAAPTAAETATITDYDLDYAATQSLPAGLQANLLVRQNSSLFFQQRFQDTLDRASQRSRRTSLTVQRNFRSLNLSLAADSIETSYGDGHQVNRHLPTLRALRTNRKLGRSGLVLGFEARAERLARGDQDLVTTYSRFDLAPRLSRPLALPFLQVNPELRLRYTHYGATLGDQGLPVDGNSLDRRYLESNLELRGPTFARVFNTPGNFLSQKFKHVIGPEVTWTYRTRIDDFTTIPKFDGNDYALGTNQINYGLVQRFYSKRTPKNAEKAETYEFLTWRLGQTYYVNIAQGQNEFDPNYRSAVFGPGGVPAHRSPLQSRLRLRPTPALSTDFYVEYDVNFRQLKTLSLSESIAIGHVFRLDGGWSKSIRTAQRIEGRQTLANTVRGNAHLELLPGHLSLEGSVDYDLLLKNVVHQSARLHYQVQCCGFLAEFIQSDFNTTQDRQYRFSIELANIGSIGNYTGTDAVARRR